MERHPLAVLLVHTQDVGFLVVGDLEAEADGVGRASSTAGLEVAGLCTMEEKGRTLTIAASGAQAQAVLMKEAQNDPVGRERRTLRQRMNHTEEMHSVTALMSAVAQAVGEQVLLHGEMVVILGVMVLLAVGEETGDMTQD